MNAKEQGFLLLTGFLGDPQRKPLTLAQFRTLSARVQNLNIDDKNRELTVSDLISIGYDRATAERILLLLSQKELLAHYARKGMDARCLAITRLSQIYPRRLRYFLGTDAPATLWGKGDASLLEKPAVALVGSRDLAPQNALFAYEVGKQAALQGFVLISGNARGADRTAQEAALAHGGNVISIVADELQNCREQKNVLYLSEQGYDLPFSAHRALQRNRIIHALAHKTFVAQCGLYKGGTWSGTKQNLQYGWSPVFCFRDGSKASLELEQMGAALITKEELSDLDGLHPAQIKFTDQ